MGGTTAPLSPVHHQPMTTCDNAWPSPPFPRPPPYTVLIVGDENEGDTHLVWTQASRNGALAQFLGPFPFFCGVNFGLGGASDGLIQKPHFGRPISRATPGRAPAVTHPRADAVFAFCPEPETATISRAIGMR